MCSLSTLSKVLLETEEVHVVCEDYHTVDFCSVHASAILNMLCPWIEQEKVILEKNKKIYEHLAAF